MKKIHVISIKISINCQSSTDLVCTKAVYQCISREIMMKKYQRQSFQTTDRAYHRILLFPVILTMVKTLFYM